VGRKHSDLDTGNFSTQKRLLTIAILSGAEGGEKREGKIPEVVARRIGKKKGRCPLKLKSGAQILSFIGEGENSSRASEEPNEKEGKFFVLPEGALVLPVFVQLQRIERKARKGVLPSHKKGSGLLIEEG